MLSVVDTSVAAIGPTGVANQIHHTVTTFQRAKVKAAHPNMCHQSRRVEPYESLIHSKGIKAMGSVNPVIESHPGASRSAESSAAANLRDMKGDFNLLLTGAKLVKPAQISKYFVLLY